MLPHALALLVWVVTVTFLLSIWEVFLCCVFKGQRWKSLGLQCLNPGCAITQSVCKEINLWYKKFPASQFFSVVSSSWQCLQQEWNVIEMRCNIIRKWRERQLFLTQASIFMMSSYQLLSPQVCHHRTLGKSTFQIYALLLTFNGKLALWYYVCISREEALYIFHKNYEY